MKNYILLLCTLVFLSCQPNANRTSEASEAEIIEVVTGETKAYMQKDYEKWASYWNHTNDVLRIDISKTGFSQTRGWKNSGGNLEAFFKENPEPIRSTFENTNYLIFADTQLAWVAFDQKWTTVSGEESVAKATITLVKKDTDWKIISYTAIQYEAGNEDVDTLDRA